MSTHGPATRGIRRSRGSRSGLLEWDSSRNPSMMPGLAGARPSSVTQCSRLVLIVSSSSFHDASNFATPSSSSTCTTSS